MSKGALLKVALLMVLGAFLVVESYYAYRLYQSPASSPAASEAGPARAQGGLAPDENAGRSFEYVFAHRADSSNISANSTYLDSPLLNGEPEAVIFITQSWNPGGGGGTYNDHRVGVWYDAERERWAIFNQDRAAMPEGASFNVAISAPDA